MCTRYMYMGGKANLWRSGICMHVHQNFYLIVTHDSALHVVMAPEKMAVPINILAVILR